MHDTKGRLGPVPNPVADPVADPVRRTFVRGLALGGITAGLGLWRNPAWALDAGNAPEILRGTAFDLRIGALPVNLTGRQRLATVVNDSLPAPTLYWREGDTVTLRVTSNLADASKHSVKNMPVLLAGGGFKHGQHLAFDENKNPPLSNLFVSMLQRMNIDADKFGSSTGTLNGLEASG